MAEQIGLEAVLQDANFQAGLKRYLAGISDAEKKTSSAASGISATLKNFGKDYAALGDKVWDFAGQVGKAMGIAGAAIAGLAIVAGKAALDTAASFEEAMHPLSALTNLTAEEIATLEKQAIELSKTMPITAAETAKGLFFIASAGFNGADAMTVMTASAKASAAGLGEFKIVADAVTSVLNAYKLNAGDASHVTDILTNAVVQGKASADSFAPAFGRILPIAAAAGVSFEQVAASMATMTRIGLSTDEAATALRGVLNALVKPGKAATDALAGMGYSADSLRDSIRDKGLLVTLQDLMDKTNGDIDSLGVIIPNVRALTGVLATAGSQGKAYSDIMDSMTKATGKTDKAFAKAAEDWDFQTAVLKNNFDALKIAVGTPLLNALKPTIQAFTEFVSRLSESGQIQAWATSISNAISSILPTIKNLVGAFQAGGVGGLMTALGITPETQAMLAGVFNFLKENLPAIMGALAGIGAFFAGSALVSAIGAVVAAIGAISLPLVAVAAAMALLGAAWAGDWGGIRTTLTDVWTNVIQPALAALWDWLAVNVPAALQILSDFWNNVLMPALNAVWGFISTNVIPLFDALANVWLAIVKKEVEALAGLWQNVLLPALTAVWNFINTSILPILNSLWTFITTNLQPVLTWLGENILPAIGNAFNGIGGAIQSVIGWLRDLANSINNLALPNWLTPGSPTPFEEGLVGVGDATQSLANDIATVLTPTLQGLSDLLQYDLTYWLGATDRGLVGLLYEVGRLSNTAQGWAERFEAAFYMVRSAIADAAAVADGLLGTLEGIRAIGTITEHIWIITHHKDVDENVENPGGGGPTGRALGGPIAANVPYIVGESGPELFLSRVAGQIIPNVSQFLRQLNSTVTMLPRTLMQTGNITNLTTNNYNLSVSTLSPAESLTADFGMLEAMAGA